MAKIELFDKRYAQEPVGVDLTQTVYSLDSPIIEFCRSLFSWNKFPVLEQPASETTILEFLRDVRQCAADSTTTTLYRRLFKPSSKMFVTINCNNQPRSLERGWLLPKQCGLIKIHKRRKWRLIAAHRPR